MKFPVIVFTAVALATAVVSTVHAQPYDRGYEHRDRDRIGGDRNWGDRDWQNRWQWRCQRDYDWCRRTCWHDEYGFLRCRQDPDDRFDWRDYDFYRRSYHDYYGRRP